MALRVLAVLAAIGMIAGALYVRTQFLDDGDASTDGSGGGSSSGDLVVACDDRLGSACPIGSQRMDADDLVSAFTERTTQLQAVVAPEVVVQMIEQSGRVQVSLGEDRPVAARTPLVLLTTPQRDADLSAECGATVTWGCVSDVVTSGALAPSFANPGSDSDGIAALAGLAGGYFEVNGGQFSLNGFTTGGFIGWLDAIQRESSTSPGAATNLVRFGGAQNDTAIVTEADGVPVLATGGAQSMGLVAHHPMPLVALDVIVAGVEDIRTRDLEDLAEEVGEALVEDGWRGADGQPTTQAAELVPGAPAMTDDDGLPSGGVMVALQGRW